MYGNYPEFSDSSTTTMESQIKIYTGRPTEGNACRAVAELAVYDFLDSVGGGVHDAVSPGSIYDGGVRSCPPGHRGARFQKSLSHQQAADTLLSADDSRRQAFQNQISLITARLCAAVICVSRGDVGVAAYRPRSRVAAGLDT